MSRQTHELDAAVAQSGRCSCGNLGKPFLTIDGGTGYLCLSCLLRDAGEREDASAMISRAGQRFHKR